VPNPGPGFCSPFGATFPFSDEKLAELYRNHGVFVFKWTRSVIKTIRDGFFVREDA
jgi:Alpha/beta hydrolase domain